MSYQPQSSKIQSLTPKQLLNSEETYLIPIYQRNYAWGNAEIEQLIVDIIDALSNAKHLKEHHKNYYLGTLVVSEKPNHSDPRRTYEVIDGQQRFTTLTLLAIFLKNHFDKINPDLMSWYIETNIDFESRPKSTQALELLLNYHLEDYSHLNNDDLSSAIIVGYKTISDVIKDKFNTDNQSEGQPKISLEEFCNYLFTHVKIARVPVPDKTDLNHYFEVMNNRGEQLEKHEIIKARMLSVIENAIDSEINQEDKILAKLLVHDVWESCANMNKYVQYGFTTNLRTHIFSDSLTRLQPSDFDQLFQIYKHVYKSNKTEQGDDNKPIQLESSADEKVIPKPTLENILFNPSFANPPNPNKTVDSKEDDGDYETYYSLVNFPNFLLHVLRIILNLQNQHSKADIALDDKQLLPQFENFILNQTHSRSGNEVQQTPLSKVKDFIYALLRSKFVFDHFVIKRNTQDDKKHWTLEKLTKGEDKNNTYYKNTFEIDNNKIVMLQSAFHVSTPTMNYKHWLNAVLYYLYQNYDDSSITDTSGTPYLSYLEALARAFMLRRYLADEPENYYQIIYKSINFNQASLKTAESNPSQDEQISQIKSYLRYGNIRNNFVFNYLDYCIWRQYDENLDKSSKEESSFYRDFVLTARSSVEHFYPQNKRDDNIFKDEKNSDNTLLHSFGNLCLISHSLNSRVSNDMPDVKIKYFLENKQVESLKLLEMIQCIKGKDVIWDKAMIEHHEKNMLDILMPKLGID